MVTSATGSHPHRHPDVRIAAFVLAVAVAVWPRTLAGAKDPDFSSWLQGVREEAIGRGVSSGTADLVLDGADLNPRILVLDRRQPEFVQPFWQYIESRVTPSRIARGQAMLARHGALLSAVQERFGVQPRFIVALWALESSFGDDTGDVALNDALATLAYDARRSAFFRGELLAFLDIVDRGDVAASARGSWAGAMGQPQFMPTTYREHAVDFDGDGRRDLWTSLADVFASAANYLAASGWRGDQTWGREVAVPPGFDLSLSGPQHERAIAEWQALGLRRADGGDLPQADVNASLLLPAGISGGPALLVYPNFHVIMTWNRSLLYAIAVGHLADRIAGGEPFAAVRPAAEVGLSRSELVEVQTLLARLGFDAGDADGILGAKTRSALQNFQQTTALPADGFPSLPVIERLRTAAAR